MIKVLYSPIVGLTTEVEYHFDGDIITVIADGVEDIFDFTGTPDGELDYLSLETEHEIRFLQRVGREDGVLWVELMNPIDAETASEFEKYPEWIEVDSHVEEIPMD